MKTTDKQKLKAKSVDQLAKQAAELEKNIFDQKMKRFTGGATNSRKYKMMRKKLATIKTFITLNQNTETQPKTNKNNWYTKNIN